MKKATKSNTTDAAALSALETLDANIDREHQVLELIRNAEYELSSITNKCDGLSREIREIMDEAAGFERKANAGGDGLDVLHAQRVRREGFAQCDVVRTELGQLRKRASELETDLHRLKNVDLPDSRCAIDFEPVLQHQDRIARLKKDIATIERHMESQQQAAANAITRDVGKLQAEIEDLRAEHVMGNVTAEELAARETELLAQVDAAEKHNQSIQQQADQTQQTVAGLLRKRDTAKAELEGLQKRTPLVLARFLKGEAERLGGQYADLAAKTKASFIRFVGLARLANAFPGVDDLLVGSWLKTHLPIVNVDKCKRLANDSVTDYLFSASSPGAGQLWADATEAERFRLNNIGIAL